MSATELVSELKALAEPERTEIIGAVLRNLYPQNGKFIERLLRRLEHPGVPEDVWEGFEDAEDGRFVEMETALNEPYPFHERQDSRHGV